MAFVLVTKDCCGLIHSPCPRIVSITSRASFPPLLSDAGGAKMVTESIQFLILGQSHCYERPI